MSSIKISALRKSQPIELEIAEGETVQYFIKEFTGADRDAWLAAQNAKYTKGPDGKPADIKDYSGVYSTLLKFCMYDASGTKLVPEAVIQQWPNLTQEALHKVAVGVNGLDADKEADPKN